MQPSFRIPWGIFCEMGAAFMENRIVVTGGRPLNGAVRIPAAKNSVLPLLAASMLCGDVRLRAVPRLSDVAASLALLRGAGCAARWEGEDILVSGTPQNSSLPGQTAEQMRASILFCAPLLAKLGRAETSLPGGCNIGARPIDLHLTGLRQMGAVEWDAGPGRLVLTAPSGLHPATSERRGTARSRTLSEHSMDAASSGSTLFFAAGMRTAPFSGRPPVTTIRFSINAAPISQKIPHSMRNEGWMFGPDRPSSLLGLFRSLLSKPTRRFPFLPAASSGWYRRRRKRAD